MQGLFDSRICYQAKSSVTQSLVRERDTTIVCNWLVCSKLTVWSITADGKWGVCFLVLKSGRTSTDNGLNSPCSQTAGYAWCRNVWRCNARNASPARSVNIRENYLVRTPNTWLLLLDRELNPTPGDSPGLEFRWALQQVWWSEIPRFQMQCSCENDLTQVSSIRTHPRTCRPRILRNLPVRPRSVIIFYQSRSRLTRYRGSPDRHTDGPECHEIFPTI